MVFCDLVGSSELSERLDPEELQDLFVGYRAVCRDAIGRYQGHLSQFLGDGVLAYFGYPVAHEEDAVRAVRTALRIIEDLKRVNQGIGERLQAETRVRVGIHSGLAVVGDSGPAGTGARLAVGETVNLAARLEPLAEPNTVLVSAATARLVQGHFELEALGTRTLRGFTKPVALFRVVRPTGAQTKFEAAARGSLSPYVGRERELAELAAAWRQVQKGADRVVVVRGEAGIGKSRLIHRFQHTGLHQGAVVAKCYCSPLMQATAFGPLIEMLNAVVSKRAKAKTAPEARLEALGSLLAEHANVGSDALPLMAALLSIPGADDGPMRELSAARRRRRTLEIMRIWLASAAEKSPYALLVEDIHWADPSTLDFLDLIVREPPGGRTLLCVMGRPEFLPRWSQPHVQVIELLRLTRSEMETMVKNLAGGHALPPLVTQGIAKRSEGVPLFVEEVTKAVLESGVLRLDTRYELAGEFDDRYLPATVQESLVARFDRLGQSRRVAQLGAAIGREFDYALIRAVAGLTDDELRGHLDALVRSELAFVRRDPPNSTYRFKHALIQDGIYETQLKSARPPVHQRIFTALEEAFPGLIADRPEVAAFHAKKAGLPRQAATYFERAAERALEAQAYLEAVNHFRSALGQLRQLPQSRERDRFELELLAALGLPLTMTQGYAAKEVMESYERARELCAEVDPPFRVFYGIWTFQAVRGSRAATRQMVEQFDRVARTTDSPAKRYISWTSMGVRHFWRGRFKEAIRALIEGQNHFDSNMVLTLPNDYGYDNPLYGHLFLMHARYLSGDVEEANTILQGVWAATKAANSPYLTVMALHYHALLSSDVGDTAGALRSTENGLELAAEHQLQFWRALAQTQHGLATCEGGRVQQGIAEIQQGLGMLRATGASHPLPYHLSYLARAYAQAREIEKGLAAVEEAMVLIRTNWDRNIEPELLRLRAELLAQGGATAEAEDCFRRGLETAAKDGSALWGLRCATGFARLLAKRGDTGRAREILAEACKGIVSGDPPVLREARSLLTELRAS
ncbi:MAG: DUF2791 family P-loop domain-containing protein [Proteobacteria bacterium]|nr:DUF2791 family P-loop domain-containing protein [Pseudomonadota bacterium]